MFFGISFAIGTMSWIPLAIGFVAQWMFGNMIIPTLIVVASLVTLSML